MSKSKTSTCLTFKSWLRRFENDSNAIGDLARDVARDPDWPGGGPGRTRRHIRDLGACEDALATHDRAWVEYRAYRETTRPCLRAKLVQRVGRDDPRSLAVDAAYLSGQTAVADELLQRTLSGIELERSMERDEQE